MNNMNDILTVMRQEESPELNTEKEEEIQKYLIKSVGKLNGAMQPKPINFKYLFDGRVQYISVKNLRVHDLVQRMLKDVNTIKIAKSIQTFGYFPEYPLLINEKGLIVSGQHRYVAARQVLNKNEKLPCIVAQFNSIKDEATYFDHVSSFMWSTLNIMERIKAKKLAGDPFILFMFKTVEDPNCLLYGQTRLPGLNTASKLFSPVIAFKIISFALLGTANRFDWNDENQAKLENRIKNTPYHQIVREINFVLNLYYKLYGYSKLAITDSIYYKHRFFMAFLIFIKKVLDEDDILHQGQEGEAKFLRGMKKMVISGPDRMLIEAWGLTANLLIANFKIYVNRKSPITPYISNDSEIEETEGESIETLNKIFIDGGSSLTSSNIPETQICKGPSENKKMAAFTMGVDLPHSGKPTELPLNNAHFYKHKNQKYGFRTVCADCTRIGNKGGQLSKENIMKFLEK